MEPSQVRRKRWLTSDIRKRTRKITKIIFAIPAAATAIPENPSTAATRATIKNPNAQRNITTSLHFRLNFARAQNRDYLHLPRFTPFVEQRRSNLHTVETLYGLRGKAAAIVAFTGYLSLGPPLRVSPYVRTYAPMFPLSCGVRRSSQQAHARTATRQRKLNV